MLLSASTLVPSVACTWLVMALATAEQSGSHTSSSSLLHVRDVKHLKQLLRTTPNLLCVFVTSSRSSSSESRQQLRVAAKAGELVRGVASILLVDCDSEDGRKVCKKYRVSPEPVVFKHYHNGVFNKDYDRQLSVPSLVRFLRDPTGELPWEEDHSASHVIHIGSRQEMSGLLRRKTKLFVLFYVPQCGYCRQLKPVYAQLAGQLKPVHALAAVDLNRPETRELTMMFNITAYPTIIHFIDGKADVTYGGGNEYQSLLKFIEDPALRPPPPPSEQPWSSEPSHVHHLTDSSFSNFLSENPSVLVMFYAPWCGHCKVLKPKYVEAADQLARSKLENGVLAAVDATVERSLSSRFKIDGFPTLKYFANGTEQFDMHLREVSAIVAFMLNPQRPDPSPASADSDSAPDHFWTPDSASDSSDEQQSSVRILNAETFQPTLRRKQHALVMFFAPWCAHCRRVAPDFSAAARHWSDDARVIFAAVDCTEEGALCRAQAVTGYPTLVYFSYHKHSRPYTAGRTREDFIAFMRDPDSSMDGSRGAADSVGPEKQWESLPGANHLKHLTEDTFNELAGRSPHLLVMFYAPWCGHCKNMKPAYAEAAERLAKEAGDDVMLATVDATQQPQLKTRFGISGFPTLKYFANGKFVRDYNDERSTSALVKFMKGVRGSRDEL